MSYNIFLGGEDDNDVWRRMFPEMRSVTVYLPLRSNPLSYRSVSDGAESYDRTTHLIEIASNSSGGGFALARHSFEKSQSVRNEA